MEVLARKFGATADFIAEARAVIGEAARTVTPAVQLSVIKEDPDDDRILECAVSAGMTASALSRSRTSSILRWLRKAVLNLGDGCCHTFGQQWWPQKDKCGER
jgi:hypothetical protein